MMALSLPRSLALALLALGALSLSGCGYHTLDSATHLPADVHQLAVPVFKTKTTAYHSEVALTNAVIRELSTRTQLRVTPSEGGEPDATLHGTILQEAATPLTYNSQTEQATSYLLTVVIDVTLTARDGHLLYQNKHYVFREQYQATSDLPRLIDENPAAMDRLSRNFARQLVGDLLESF